MFKKIVVIIAVLALTLTACTPQNEDIQQTVPTNDTAIETPEHGGTMHLSMRRPSTLNPLLNEDVTVARVLRLVYEPLFRLDDNLRPRPHIAESVTVSEDGLNVEITIGNVHFSDGTRVTADDVVYSFQTLISAPENAIYKRHVQNVASVYRRDASTVAVRLRQPQSTFEYHLVFPIVSRSGEGVGAFVFESRDGARQLTLLSTGETFINRIIVFFTNDFESDLNALNHNVIDALPATFSEWARFSQASVRITEYTENHFDFLGFNFNRPIFQNRNVRHAIAHLVPSEDIIRLAYLEHAVVATTPLHPSSWLYRGQNRTYAHDVARARELLDAEGFETLSFNIIVNREHEERVRTARMIAASFERAGLSLGVYELSSEDFLRRLNNREYDMFLGGSKLSAAPEFEFLFGAGNPMGYSDETMVQLLYAASRAVGETETILTFAALQNHIMDELPIIGIAFWNTAFLTSQRVRGDVNPVMGDVFANIREWFIVSNEL